MGLNKLVGRIKKYLDRNLNFSMREFKQLQSLKEDILKLEQIMSYSGGNRTALLSYYKKHARKLQRYSERIERRLNARINRLEELITAEEQSLIAGDRQYFELFKNKIDVCKNNLVRILARGGELHSLINEESPDWKKIEAKINEALGDNEHPGIRTLIALFQNLEHVEDRLGNASMTPEGHRIGILASKRSKFQQKFEDGLFELAKQTNLSDTQIEMALLHAGYTNSEIQAAALRIRSKLPQINEILFAKLKESLAGKFDVNKLEIGTNSGYITIDDDELRIRLLAFPYGRTSIPHIKNIFNRGNTRSGIATGIIKAWEDTMLYFGYQIVGIRKVEFHAMQFWINRGYKPITVEQGFAPRNPNSLWIKPLTEEGKLTIQEIEAMHYDPEEGVEFKFMDNLGRRYEKKYDDKTTTAVNQLIDSSLRN